ncbi:MAG: cytochrome c3 family protein [Myxococcota bacterium]
MSRGAIAAGLLLALAASLEAAAAPDLQESTCISCHRDEEAGVPERSVVEVGEALRFEVALSAPLREWSESIHAVHDVSCDACHGGDPWEEDADLSMSEEAGFLENPSWMEMGDYCGVCHEEVATGFARGRFGEQMRQGLRVATCDTCHMAEGHRIVEASPEELLVTACADCPAMLDGIALVRSLHELRGWHDVLVERVQGVEARGGELADVGAELERLRGEVSRAVHSFDAERIRTTHAEALERYGDLDALVREVDQGLAARRGPGLVLLLSLALLFAALLLWERTLRRSR